LNSNIDIGRSIVGIFHFGHTLKISERCRVLSVYSHCLYSGAQTQSLVSSQCRRSNRRNSYIKRTPGGYQDPALWVLLGIVFSPLRRTNFKTTHYLLSYFFLFNTLKGTAELPLVNRLRLNTLRGTKTAFLPLKGSTSTPVLFK